MLQNRKKILITVASLGCVLSLGAMVSGAYVNTNRDTRPAPAMVDSFLEVTSEYETLYENDKFEYSFREDRDILAIKNKETGYVWKTGLDLPFNAQITKAKRVKTTVEKQKEKIAEAEAILAKAGATEDEKKNAESDIAAANDRISKAIEKEDELITSLGLDGMEEKELLEAIYEVADSPKDTSFNSEIFSARANSLVTVQYVGGQGDGFTTKNYVSSAASDSSEGKSSITPDSTDGKKWKLTVEMEKIKLGFNVYMTFDDEGNVTFDVPYDEIGGEGMDKLVGVILCPYLGASGGEEEVTNEETRERITTDKYLTPGYAFIPDGSGALVEFTKNEANFEEYKGYVYGEDPSARQRYKNDLQESVPLKNPVMPVFGISHGDGTQSAYVAYATKGDEYMTIMCDTFSRAKNQIRYTYVHPMFTYNFDYFYVINQAGQTYRKTREVPNKFDISITYSFLYGDGSDGQPKADYTGMALKYRQHLIEEGILTEKETENTDIPIRLDFLMSDSKKGVISTSPVIMTTTDDVAKILDKVRDDGIKNINSGLIGWQKNGETLSKPGKAKYTGKIGSQKDFARLISKSKNEGTDISLSRDFLLINKSMTTYYNVAAKHTNTQYNVLNKSALLPDNVPVSVFAYALPTKSAEWMKSLYKDIKNFSESFTVTGISNTLVSSHNQDGSEFTLEDTIKLYQDTLEEIRQDGVKINMDAPNQYMWKYTDRYLQSPVGTSQYIFETSTVPFLQMVLHGTMEVYAPYSNFSFYTDEAMLRMIDYNISPSFILTKEPSYLLESTASAEFYSTEYDQYQPLIKTIYETVNGVLSQVSGYEWVGRTVLNEENGGGVIENRYKKGSDERVVVINYSDEVFFYNSTPVEPKKAIVTDYVAPANTEEGGAN
ncbi:MAG: hypothetical protein IKN54_03555 [Lachnospiraceae bacterium]|nr:hypothetical protein [Lachnospiraceae bacterium]